MRVSSRAAAPLSSPSSFRSVDPHDPALPCSIISRNFAVVGQSLMDPCSCPKCTIPTRPRRRRPGRSNLAPRASRQSPSPTPSSQTTRRGSSTTRRCLAPLDVDPGTPRGEGMRRAAAPGLGEGPARIGPPQRTTTLDASVPTTPGPIPVAQPTPPPPLPRSRPDERSQCEIGLGTDRQRPLRTFSRALPHRSSAHELAKRQIAITPQRYSTLAKREPRPLAKKQKRYVPSLHLVRMLTSP